ncbi:DUF3006 domain-containing protein [Deinococcus sp.]|uniref:DUF3006 domain-containing protein n=1 Tax=Deinococcus sp. TaxID=47478 RepID=UPI0025B99329|nr:DUF3006 domain-containing protein [Deinococcus sp.]
MKHSSRSAPTPAPLPDQAESAQPQAPASAAESSERWTVDGIEETPQGQVARIELPDGTTRDIDLTALPEGLQEGDLLAVEPHPDGLKLTILHEETSVARQQAQSRLGALNAAAAADPDKEITL